MNRNLAKAIKFFIIFILIWVFIATVDVRNGVGLFFINSPVSELLHFREALFNISDYLGFIPVLFVVFFAMKGFIQMVKRKGIFKVDNDIIIMGILYIILLALYVFFSKLNVNLRPVFIDGQNEASFPSSHTLLQVTVMSVAAWYFRKNGFNKICIFCYAELGLGVLTRLCSGVHWFTDIVAGTFLALALFNLYVWACSKIKIGGREWTK